MSHIEAMKQWREALVKVYDNVSFYDEVRQAIESIDQAIAEADKQEQGGPLEYWNAVEGWVKIDEVREHFDSVGCGTIYKAAGEDRVPLYTTPQQRKPLTDEEIGDQFVRFQVGGMFTPFLYAVRAIEAAHGITSDMKQEHVAKTAKQRHEENT